MSKVLTTAEIDNARRAGKMADATEPRATAVHYASASSHLVIALKNGVILSVPVELLQGVAGATAEDIAQVEIEGDGYALHWETLDADLTVAGIVSGIFGTKQWMAEIGARGGSRSSDAKSAAARLNGRKGGRPRQKAMA